jgi:hypothetical protein
MAKVICVCNNVPDTIISLLSDIVKDVKYSLLEINKKYPKIPKSKFLFALSFPDFLNSLKKVNSDNYNETTIFLFCSAVQAKTLSHVYLLDLMKNSKTSCLIKSFYKDLSPEVLSGFLHKSFSSKRKVREIDKEFKYRLIDSIKSGSLLNPMMTLLYSVKADGHIRIKQLIFEFLTSSKMKVSDLESMLKKSYEWGTISTQFRTKLIALLTSELGQKYKSVLQKVYDSRKSSEVISIQSLAKKNEIDAYEIKYIMNVLMKQKKKSLTGKCFTEIYNKENRVAKK